jgi:hypothetical protein
MCGVAIVGAGIGSGLIARGLTKYRQKIKNTGIHPGELCVMVKGADRQSPERAGRGSYVLAGHPKEGC